MAEVDVPGDEITLDRCCSPSEEVAGHLATLSVNGADNGEAEQEILYAIGDYTGVGEDQVRDLDL